MLIFRNIKISFSQKGNTEIEESGEKFLRLPIVLVCAAIRED
ncbi:hypothetical protein PCC8801_2776 [Rippkaea orientalis PCC 8801]|uniref:Uncharacterized protein n=1 Tax=Rippkaea orientalis (strain PCC 8801 / RF-1) TaxID=41431 RepID=B7K5P4_RIPO1|nr:hypothetical protein PCC8801_2776 [Rippkaea orientalis PCC 8801]